MQAERLDDGNKEEESCRQCESFSNALSTTNTKEADVLIQPRELSFWGQKPIWVKLPRVLKQRTKVTQKKNQSCLSAITQEVVQQNFTPGIEVFYMLFERYISFLL